MGVGTRVIKNLRIFVGAVRVFLFKKKYLSFEVKVTNNWRTKGPFSVFVSSSPFLGDMSIFRGFLGDMFWM